MTVYAIAQLTIHDRARYDRYVAGFMPILLHFGGRLLAADDHPRLIEGDWTGDKVILMEFPDRDTFTAWSTSPAYLEISKDRTAATTGPVILIRGLT
jgi:uncharacterized protein (DUF1330 family)